MRILATSLAAGLALAAAACTSTSQEGGTQSAAETVVTTDELRQLLTGRTATFSSGDQARYLADGRYEYRGRQVDRGTYSFGNDQVCVAFEAGQQRCDRYVRRGDQYILVNASGRRFPVRIG